MKIGLLYAWQAKEVNSKAPNQTQGRSVRVNRQRRSRGRKNPGDSVGKYASDAWSLAKRTAYGLNEIRKLINIETKVLNTSGQSTTAMDTVGTIVSFSTMAQGIDYAQNRIGDSIKLQRIEARYRISMSSTATKTFCRVIFFRDLDGYGTTPTVTDVLETADVLSPFKFLNKDRFSILYDELSCLSTTGDASEVATINMNHDGHIKYLGTTAAAASNGKGSLYFLILSNETGTNVPTFAHNERIYFTDD